MCYCSKNLWYALYLLSGKIAYDEYHGKSWINSGKIMLWKSMAHDFTVLAAAKTNFIPTFPLPENAEYAGEMGCTKPLKRRRLFVAHMYSGSTKKTLDSHKQHLCKFKIDPNADFVYCPSACYLNYVKRTYPDCVDLGVQNIYPAECGNFTGEVSIPMVKDLGAKYVLIGTTHRRVFLGETDRFIRAKVRDVLDNQMSCIIFLTNTTGGCDSCSTEAMVSRQLEAVMPSIFIDEWDRVAFACEPPVCPEDQDSHELVFKTITAAQAMCKLVRDKVADRVGDEIAQRLRVLYSGDMCHGSAPMFMTQEDIDGAVFCPRHDSECFINIVNSGLLVDRREEEMEKKKKK